MLDLPSVLQSLSKSRPLFHSEADFQFAFAWEIQRRWPEATVRLEYRPAYLDRRGYLDIWVKDHEVSVAIELKYWTRSLDIQAGDEEFRLLTQGAQDLSRYDFVKDIARVESVVAHNANCRGFIIALTNDPSFWQQPARTVETIDWTFRIHEGARLSGRLGWAAHAGAGTTRGRQEDLVLTGAYGSAWKEYSELASGTYRKFRYLLLEIAPGLADPIPRDLVQPRPVAKPDKQPTLHAVMLGVLREHGRPMNARELADEINRTGRYRQRAGTPVPIGQIHARTHNYPHLFERTSRGIQPVGGF